MGSLIQARQARDVEAVTIRVTLVSDLRDCPIAMPTWMMHRELYTAGESLGNFSQSILMKRQLVDLSKALVCLRILFFFISIWQEEALSQKLTRFAHVSIVHHVLCWFCMTLSLPGNYGVQARRILCFVCLVEGASHASKPIDTLRQLLAPSISTRRSVPMLFKVSYFLSVAGRSSVYGVVGAMANDFSIF